MPLEPLPKELQAECIAKALESSKPTSRPSISILGYGVTTKPIVAFLNARGISCAIYDDKPEGKKVDSMLGVENVLLHSSEFRPESSALEILSPGIPPEHRHFGGARRAVSEYDFIWWLCEDLVLGSHSADLADFEGSQTSSLVSPPKFAKNYESNTAIPRILENAGQTKKLDSSQSSLRGEAIHTDAQKVESSMDCHADKSARNDKNNSALDCHATATALARNDKNSAIGEKLDSSFAPSSRAVCQHGVAIHNSAQVDSKGDYLASTKSPQQSAILAQKPTPSAQIWISGTNGKTTTTQMLESILSPAGARAGGNIGTPLATLYEECARIWVLETSSFALHYTKSATPRIYALLPLSQDHISWHSGFDGYVADKLSPLARMSASSVAIIPSALRDHRLCREFLGEMVFYKDSSDLRAYLLAQGLKQNALDTLPFFEPFLLDAYVALSCALALNHTCPELLTPAQVANLLPTLACFKIGAHRMEEFLVEAFGESWLFVDDSKGTNTDATLQAITRYKDRTLLLILGGDDKGADCSEIFTLLQRVPKAQIFTIGSNEPKLLDLAARHSVKAHKCGTLGCAMEKIWAIIAESMDSRETAESIKTIEPSKAQFSRPSQDFVCLLSPAAASLDQFSSYKERGEMFKALATSLPTTPKGF